MKLVLCVLLMTAGLQAMKEVHCHEIVLGTGRLKEICFRGKIELDCSVLRFSDDVRRKEYEELLRRDPSYYWTLLLSGVTYQDLQRVAPETFHPLLVTLLQRSLNHFGFDKPHSFSKATELIRKRGMPNAHAILFAQLADPDERWAACSHPPQKLQERRVAVLALEVIEARRRKAELSNNTSDLRALESLFGSK
jgi:hypothetical protein